MIAQQALQWSLLRQCHASQLRRAQRWDRQWEQQWERRRVLWWGHAVHAAGCIRTRRACSSACCTAACCERSAARADSLLRPPNATRYLSRLQNGQLQPSFPGDASATFVQPRRSPPLRDSASRTTEHQGSAAVSGGNRSALHAGQHTCSRNLQRKPLLIEDD